MSEWLLQTKGKYVSTLLSAGRVGLHIHDDLNSTVLEKNVGRKFSPLYGSQITLVVNLIISI